MYKGYWKPLFQGQSNLRGPKIKKNHSSTPSLFCPTHVQQWDLCTLGVILGSLLVPLSLSSVRLSTNVHKASKWSHKRFRGEKVNILFSIYKRFYELLLKDYHLCILFLNAYILVLGEEKEDTNVKGIYRAIENKKKKNYHGSFMVFLKVTFVPLKDFFKAFSNFLHILNYNLKIFLKISNCKLCYCICKSRRV